MDNQWVNPTTGRQPLYTGPEKFVGSFSRRIQVLREGGLDVVFVFDSTSSMAGYIDEVKHKIENLATTFKKLVPTCRIGLVTYRDKQEEYVTKFHPLTYGISSLHDFLVSTEAEGGRDVEEAVEEALKVAVEKIEWNKKSKKFILLIGDAPPHKEDMPLAVEMIKKFREQIGGTLSALDTRPITKVSKAYWDAVVTPYTTGTYSGSSSYMDYTKGVMQEYQIFAETGGGGCARLINEEKVVRNMLLFIFGTRWEAYLDEFMKNL